MAQLIPLDPPLFATERGTQDPRLVIAWILRDDDVYALVTGPTGDIEAIGISGLSSTLRYDFKNEAWYDEYESVQDEMKKADRKG